MNPYEVLGVEPSATAEEIKLAYRRLSRLYHPDVSQEPDREARMRDVNKAWEILGSEERKAKYDATGATEESSTVEAQATEMLAKMFGAALDNNAPEPIDAVRQMLLSNMAQEAAGTNSLLTKIGMLEAQAKRIRSKTKGDQHIVANLIAERIKSCRNGIEGNTRSRLMLTQAMLLLSDFESVQESNQQITSISFIPNSIIFR